MKLDDNPLRVLVTLKSTLGPLVDLNLHMVSIVAPYGDTQIFDCTMKWRRNAWPKAIRDASLFSCISLTKRFTEKAGPFFRGGRGPAFLTHIYIIPSGR